MTFKINNQNTKPQESVFAVKLREALARQEAAAKAAEQKKESK